MSKKEVKKRKKRIFIITIILILSVILIFIGTKVYLYVNLLLGNDLVIILNTDKENLFLIHGQSEKINIKISSVTNPFCTALCKYEFIDLSKGEIIEDDDFKLATSRFISKEYIINANKKGSGQDLYRFDIECNNIKNYLCNTKETLKSKSVLFTVDYDLNDEEKRIKEESKEKIIFLIQNLNQMLLELNEFNKAIEKLSEVIYINNFKKEINESEFSLIEFNQNVLNLKNLFENEDYYVLQEKIQDAEKEFYELESNFNTVKNDFLFNLSSYNNLIENTTKTRQKLIEFNNTGVTKNTFIEVNNIIDEFNNFINSFKKKDYLYNKELLFNIIFDKVEVISKMIKDDIKEGVNLDYNIIISVSELNLTKIDLGKIEHDITILFKESYPLCCLNNKCEECCNEECKNDKDKFPVIFLHGHSFNKKTSAEYSLDIFSEMQKKLENDGYINAGAIYFGDYNDITRGIFGKNRNPFSFKISYYFDILSNEGNNIVIQTKTDSIDTYTIRLRDIIENVKYKTNKDKVIIIAHSMGGLVVRRYIQIFGSDNIERVILIATPNKGINKKIVKICSLFGTEIECRDMDKESLFMNKLNNMKEINIPVYNIIGTGCEMDEEKGDGITEENSAYLNNVNNYYVNGTCEEVKFRLLHNEIVNIDKYPEVYQIINNSLKKNNFIF